MNIHIFMCCLVYFTLKSKIQEFDSIQSNFNNSDHNLQKKIIESLKTTQFSSYIVYEEK